MPPPRRSEEPFVAHLIAGVILGLVFWGGGYLFGDLLFSWAMGLVHWEAGLFSFADRGFLEALFLVVVAIGVAIVAIPLVILAGLIYYGTRFYVIALLGFLLGFSPGLGGHVAVLVRRFLGVVGAVLALPFGAAWSLPKHRTWRARLIDLGAIVLFLAVLAGGWFATRRALIAPPRPPDRILEERPHAFTAGWHCAASSSVRAYVWLVSITPERMAVTLRFQNLSNATVHFMLSNKLVANGSRGSNALAGDLLTSRTGDGRVPLRSAAAGTGDVVNIPPGRFLEGTYYFPHPPNPRRFWEVSFRWAESDSRDLTYVPGWTTYAASASFDFRERGALGPLFPINPLPTREALRVPSGAGGLRW